MRSLVRLVFVLALVAAVAATLLASRGLLRGDVEAAVYRARLIELAGDFERLRTQYNEAVQRTAVTELRVEGGHLAVVVRDATGRERRIDTAFDPGGEVYVDFAVLDGRLWIRRVFDASTPPQRGLLIDPGLADVDWSRDPEAFGKAAYRSLGEGRWVVSVTGDGSLGLARSPNDEPPELAPPPPVRDYPPLEQAVDARLGEIRGAEALRAVASRLADWD